MNATPPFRTMVDIQLRFGDTDALGHVNNATYLSYLELARIEYVARLFGISDWRQLDFILARVEIDYRSPAVMGDDIVVAVRVSRLGGASFDMEYRITEKKTGRLVAEAKTVQVCFDHAANKVKRLSAAFKEKVRGFDGLA